MKKKFTLLKIGEKEHMEALLAKGTIYCNTRHYFATLNDGTTDGRGDPHENVVNIRNDIRGISIFDRKTKKEREILVTSGQYREFINLHEPSGNIFCLYAYDFLKKFIGNDIIHYLDIDCELDDFCVLIFDTPEFISRIGKKLDSLNIRHNSQLVRYKDLKKHNGKTTPFIKDIKFANQNEFRFFIENPKNETLSFDIGSIQDIASLYSREELLKTPWKGTALFNKTKI